MSRYYRSILSIPNYIVDQYNPDAAFSVRKISSTSTSSIRVRRTPDNSELDIGFIGIDLDVDSLTDFVGTGSGHIKTLYDQTSNNDHLTQTRKERQSIIILSGSLIMQGIRPAIDFDDTNDQYSDSSPGDITTPKATIISVYYNNEITNKNRIAGYTTSSLGKFIFAQDSDNSLRFDKSIQFGSIPKTTSHKLRFSQRSTTHVYDYINNTENINTTDSLPNINGSLNIGNPVSSGSQYFNGTIQEIIFFHSEQLENRDLIQKNINSYYSIYPQ